jgi:prephenate dehydrogenase
MSSPPEPPFRSIAIAGLGLIGGSIALAVRDRWPSTRVIGIDTPSVLAHALGSGAIDRADDGIGVVAEVDLLVLAAPVKQNLALLAELSAALPGDSAAARVTIPGRGLIVTDVGGTKRSIVEAARRLPDRVVFVGGHPLGGGERGGFAFARPDLFVGRPWIFTPDGDRSAAAVPRLAQFAAGLGARATTLRPDEHDQLMAYVSHLPQLVASALMEVVGAHAGVDGLRLAGRGLLDTTRLASSPPDVWRDICATNTETIGEAIDRLIERLTELRSDLDGGDSLETIFDAAARWRTELLKHT